MNEQPPTIFTGRQMLPWQMVEELGDIRAGQVMLTEVLRTIRSVRAKVEEVLPGHQLDKGSLMIEIGVQYRVLPDGEA